jgi:ATP dependent DNA ligase domain
MPADPLRSLPKTKAGFVEPMDWLPVPKLPDGSQWLWEIKLDGYRAVAVKSGGAVTLYSRNRKILNKRFPYIVEPLRGLPDGIVIDGEIVALDDDGRPAFNLLQNFTSESSRIRYFLFDLLCYKDRDLTRLPLVKRRGLLRSLKFDDQRIVIGDYIEVSAEQMLAAVREQRLEGVVGKQRDSRYEPGKRSGVEIKHRVNLGQEFVIGGFTPGPHGLDAIIVGYYRDNELIYVARTRNGFVPASRRRVFEKLRPLVTPKCPFVNLPETHTVTAGGWRFQESGITTTFNGRWFLTIFAQNGTQGDHPPDDAELGEAGALQEAGDHVGHALKLPGVFLHLLFPSLCKPLGRFAQQPTYRPILFLGNPLEFCQGLLVNPNSQPLHVISSYDILHYTSKRSRMLSWSQKPSQSFCSLRPSYRGHPVLNPQSHQP